MPVILISLLFGTYRTGILCCIYFVVNQVNGIWDCVVASLRICQSSSDAVRTPSVTTSLSSSDEMSNNGEYLLFVFYIFNANVYEPITS